MFFVPRWYRKFRSKHLIVKYPDAFRVLPEIIDLRLSLPNHPDRTWYQRSNNATIHYIVVHQAAFAGTLESINKYHITPTKDRDGDREIFPWERNHISPKGCPHICYHFAVNRAGKIFRLNSMNDITWHCKGQNRVSVGVLMLGDFEGPSYKPNVLHPNPSKQQMIGLHHLLRYLSKTVVRCKDAKIYGHSHFDPENKANCPGTVIGSYLTSFGVESQFNEAERFLEGYTK